LNSERRITMPWKVDEDLCTGCEVCCDTAPSVFQMDEEEGVAICTDNSVGEGDEKAQQAAEECPVEAISFEA